MRDYTGILVVDIENATLRDKLGKIDYFLRDLSRGIGRIQEGLVPDGSGDTIIDNGPLSDIYLVLLGRSTNQVAHGGKSPGGTLTLASTTNATKGMVYLGNAQQTVYDETNERIGIRQPTPTAKVHIKVGTSSNQAPLPSAASMGGLDWGVVGGTYPTVLKDSSDSTGARYTGGLGVTNLTVDFDNLTTAVDPLVDTGFKIRFRTGASGPNFTTGTNVRMSVNFTNMGGPAISSNVHFIGGPSNTTTPNDGACGTSVAQYEVTFSDAECALFDFSKQWEATISYSGQATNGSDTWNFTEVSIIIPPLGGLGGDDTLQKWESPSVINALSYASDALNNTVLMFTGAPHVAVSASGFDLSIGSPASGMVWSSTNAVGAGAWASASSLATKGEHTFIANGPYKIDRDVDGAWIAPRAGTLSLVRLYRRQPGSGGSTAVELLKNGTTVFSAPPNIAASAGASATASGTISVTTYVAGDRFTASASAVDTGRPFDYALKMEYYG